MPGLRGLLLLLGLFGLVLRVVDLQEFVEEPDHAVTLPVVAGRRGEKAGHLPDGDQVVFTEELDLLAVLRGRLDLLPCQGFHPEREPLGLEQVLEHWGEG